jgi:hypothetical protein
LNRKRKSNPQKEERKNMANVKPSNQPQGQKQAAQPQAQPAQTGPKPSLLERIRTQVSQMKPEDVQAALAKIRTQRAKQAAKRGELTPEAKAKRTEYNKRRLQRPEVKAKMKEYRTQPAVKERMKEYRKARNERQKAILARAKELGLTGAATAS